MEISAMRMNFLALGLSLCLVLSSFHEVSSQDDGTTRLSNLDLIEREYQASVNALQGEEDEDQSTKIQSENQKNTTVTDKNTISLSLSDESDGTYSDSVDNSTQVGAVSDESVKRSSLLDQIELEFEAHLNGLNQAGSDVVKAESKNDDQLSAQRQKMLEDMERDFEAASTSLKQLKTDELSEGNYEEQAAKRQSLLEEIEREFDIATKDLEQLKVNDFTGDKDDEEQSAKRKSMLDAIEREFEAAIEGLEELKVSDSTGSKNDEEQSAKRLSMLEEIEREFEAATKGLEHLKASDLTGEKFEDEQVAKRQRMLEEIERDFQAATDSLKQLQVDHSTDSTEQNAQRQSMLEEIEREFEAATKGLTKLKVNDFTEVNDNEEQSAKRKSMLEEIEREFEAAIGGLKQIQQIDDSKHIEEQSAKRKIMLEEMEREFEEAQSGFSANANKEESAKKQSTSEILGLGQSGVCGCFNQDSSGFKQEEDASIAISEKYSIDEILSEESATQGTETSSSLTKSLTQIVENHRKEKESHYAHRALTSSSSSSSTSESSATSETVESLRAKLKELRGLTARQLVTRQDFEEILVMAASFEELSSAPISYISRLAKYRNVIKEGLEASKRVHITKTRAKMLKETATEKQTFVDANFSAAKTLAQRGDALYVRIFAIKKLLKKLEAERESVDVKFKEIVNGLSHLLVDASEAYEEYHGEVRKAKDEQAAEEFAREAIQSAEITWVKFLSSL
ncbi:TSK-associating protein 1 isoform X2 [Eutrema salsugineum]|uniref:TSK-associating protein 1 isoform X2 n=1 Tax=Eutrema salsugineum TaxID=72664 RepID=UPI000CED7736|nr:TSK-associating protein 1 isoform X2 [Eutrema salsugineum]